jgi:hypothetical protein
MQLTESEKKALHKAKKMEARWPRTRWIALAFGLVWCSIGFIDIAIRPIIPWAGSVLLGMGIAQWIVIPRIWNGRPTLKLLIKFAEKNQENPS